MFPLIIHVHSHIYFGSMQNNRLMIDNWHILEELYGMDDQ